MDNQLIFWYRRSNARAEAGDTKHARPSVSPFGVVGWLSL